MFRKGFTLIELLLVVGVIAILAAIAVPNFLEAKTRTKIAKAKADMRTIGTALSTFYIDHFDQYPNVSTLDFISRLIPLTTPVVYMRSLPEDPFATGLPPAFKNPDWMVAYKIHKEFVYPFTFEYMNRKPLDTYWTQIAANPATAEWALKSVGPDKLPIWFGSNLLVTYDPSNGTTSRGEVIITGPGLRPEGPAR